MNLITSLKKFFRKPTPQRLTERILTEDGELFHEGPYLFRRLFAPGQGMAMNSKSMTVLSCEVEGDTVKTIVRIHKP